MDTFSFCRNLVVVAALMSSVSGFFVHNNLKASFFGDKPLKELSRLARDENEAMSAPAPSHSASSMSACRATQSCMYSNRAYAVMMHIFEFEFDDLIQGLVEVCPTLDVMACLDDDCQRNTQRLLLTFHNNIMEWACNHRQDFQDNVACWAEPFPSVMKVCSEPPEDGMDSHTPGDQFDYISKCFERTVQTLPSCTPEAQDFFKEFSSHVLREQNALYEGFYLEQ